MTDMKAGVRRYLEYVLDAEDLSPTALARKCGIASTTLTRFLNDENHKFILTNSTIEKIQKATGINPSPFIADLDTAQLTASVMADAIAKVPKSNKERFVFLTTIGECGHGLWREVGIWNDGIFRPHFMIPSGFDPNKCFGLIVRGNSCDLVARDGEFLICTQIEEWLAFSRFTRQASLTNQVAIVESRSEAGNLIEFTARSIFETSTGVVLSLPSNDTNLRADQLVFDRLELPLEGRRRVIGIALAVVRYISFGPGA